MMQQISTLSFLILLSIFLESQSKKLSDLYKLGKITADEDYCSIELDKCTKKLKNDKSSTSSPMTFSKTCENRNSYLECARKLKGKVLTVKNNVKVLCTIEHFDIFESCIKNACKDACKCEMSHCEEFSKDKCQKWYCQRNANRHCQGEFINSNFNSPSMIVLDVIKLICRETKNIFTKNQCIHKKKRDNLISYCSLYSQKTEKRKKNGVYSSTTLLYAKTELLN
ncbi:DgyrCDS14155 [Dimorphilus gyrociliatus]|uniref:DgyrCDS14155 n=1 Tax=Dimorphilus gyrociliatus TaxID=2664684 RepID=A0A7I8WCT8_9ANNE|nr:DgyrCDS14155 [Dimorphilus gyrociliatus]